MKVEFPRSVTVYGTGLMGSSLALALKRAIPSVRVYGIDEPEILSQARSLGIVEGADPEESHRADLVILAAPVGAILELLDRLQIKAELVIDVGSTKVEICKKAQKRGLPFLGAHPMTGSERSGPEAASGDLFNNAPFFLCPISTTPVNAVARVRAIVEAIGAKPHVITPEAHDLLAAQLSHLPQILSTLLAGHADAPMDLAGPGWKSFTRLAASPFHVWRDILKTSGALPHELRSFAARLQTVIEALEAGRMEDIEAMFERANRAVSGGERE